MPAAVAGVLEQVLNQYVRLDPDSPQRISDLSGKVVAFELSGMDVVLFVQLTDGAIQIYDSFDSEPDARIQLTPAALMRMGWQRCHDSEILFTGDVHISGDVDLGQRVKSLFLDMDVDWEEQLSRVVGDIAAHQIGNALRTMRDWGASTAATLGHNGAEYLQEESRLLPLRDHVDAFLSDVDVLRSDADRAEARIARLETVLAARRN